jgi:Putative methyltransferase
MPSEWVAWHQQYRAKGGLTRRLAIVRELLRAALDALPPGEIRAISLCAGDGRDLLGVLHSHPRGPDVRARLIDTDATLVARGRARARRYRLGRVEFVRRDAGSTSSCRGAVPADLVLVCGIFGNISNAEIRRTVHALPSLCARGATVVWTRGRFAPDLTPTIRRWFGEAGFEEVAFVRIPESTMSVGAHRLVGAPRPLGSGQRLFTFLPREERPGVRAERRARRSVRARPRRAAAPRSRPS